MTSRRKSAQRERIYETVFAVKTHPTAKWVFDELRKRDPNASLGNVYRNLNILVEEGRITRSTYGDGVEHFDATTSPHAHFVCARCNGVYDLDVPAKKLALILRGLQTAHTIERYRLDVFGVCEACGKRAKRKKGDHPL